MASNIVAGSTHERYNEVDVYEILLPAKLSIVLDLVTFLFSYMDQPSRHDPR